MFVFFLSGFVAGVLFLQLARNWADFMIYWRRKETDVESYGVPVNLSRTFNRIMGSVLLMATGSSSSSHPNIRY